MHAWEGQQFSDIERIPQDRDPRRFPLGCIIANGECEVVQWFRNMPEIAQWLRRMEPQRWGLRGPELIRIKAELEPVLTRVDVYGLDDASRAAHNAVTQAFYRIVTWGDFKALANREDAANTMHNALRQQAQLASTLPST